MEPARGLVGPWGAGQFRTRVPGLGAWGPPSRWWRGNRPEWDLVAESEDGRRLILGEVKWREAPFLKTNLEREPSALRHKTAPSLPARYGRHEAVRVLFVPEVASGIRIPKDLHVVTARDLLG